MPHQLYLTHCCFCCRNLRKSVVATEVQPVFAMSIRMTVAARSECAQACVIRNSHGVQASSRPTPSSASSHAAASPARLRQALSSSAPCFSGRQHDSGRRVTAAAAATAAEPIAFARTPPSEPEEEAFYSILGIVRLTLLPAPVGL